VKFCKSFIIETPQIRSVFFLTLFFSTLLRVFLASFTELGNDEVYYINYALFPALSHFDHPPFVGWLIQLFTLNLHFTHEFFVRLGPILIGLLNTCIIFTIGKKLKNEKTGLYAALLYTASLYGFIIVGVFIMPDTAQGLFWLLSLWIIVTLFKKENIDRNSQWLMLLLGLTIGCGMLSKYTTLFIWAGVGLYVLFFDRKWFTKPALYLAPLVSILVFLPVIIWNIQHDFITFTFHSERVVSNVFIFDYQTFLIEIVGSFFYNNFISVGIFLTAIGSYVKNKFVEKKLLWLLLFLSLPLILLFIVISMVKPTLPHWSGPGYYALMLLGALFLDRKPLHRTVPLSLIIALATSLIVIVLAVTQIKTGMVNFSKNDPVERMGRSDFTLDMYGYKKLNTKFSELHQKYMQQGIVPKNTVMLGYKWFPTAHIDFYVAQRNNLQMLTCSPLSEAHEYYWITEKRGGLQEDMSAYFLNSSRYYFNMERWREQFENMMPLDTIYIHRNGKEAVYYVVWFLKK
jgi:hypothetical protein